MGIFDDVLRSFGLGGTKKGKRSQGPLGLPPLPNPSEVQGAVEQLIEGASKLKEVPKALADRAAEASGDFQTADQALRGARIRTGRKRN